MGAASSHVLGSLGLTGLFVMEYVDGMMHTRFNDSSSPYIVLLESIIPGKSLAKFKLIGLDDLIDSLQNDTKRQIYPNGHIHAKVFCDWWQAANVLVDSSALVNILPPNCTNDWSQIWSPISSPFVVAV